MEYNIVKKNKQPWYYFKKYLNKKKSDQRWLFEKNLIFFSPPIMA